MTRTHSLNGHEAGTFAWCGLNSINIVWGSPHNDLLYGDDTNNFMRGGSGNDQMWGGDGDDALMGGPGNDTLYGEAGNDILSGGTGENTSDGGNGNDKLIIGHGADWMLGGLGDDTFIANRFSTGRATIADWRAGNDTINLHGFLATRHLDASGVYFDTDTQPGATIIGVDGTSLSLAVLGTNITDFDTSDLQSEGIIHAQLSSALLDDVPAYNWYHGCGPTAAASVLAYYDVHG